MISVNGKNIESFLFSGGEVHLSLATIEIDETTKITAKLDSSEEVMKLLLVVDAVRRKNVQSSIELKIPYFPYARQDRVCNPGEALSVKVMADLINNLHCDLVEIFDPHSDVTPALINNCKIHSMAEIIAQSSIKETLISKKLVVVSPDAGADKKVQAVAKALGLEALSASKKRDTKTGKITSVSVHGVEKNRNYIILDDICDGGQTFIGLAQELKSQGAGDIYLYVTHGIFSKGLEVLKPHFKNIFTYHTLGKAGPFNDPFLTQFSEEI